MKRSDAKVEVIRLRDLVDDLKTENRRLREACRQAFKMLVRSEGAGAAEAEQVLGAAMEGKP